MAIKSEFPDGTGQTLFTEWSALGDSFNPIDCASTWRSIKGSGGVTIATLLHLAKANGYVMPKTDQIAVQPDPAAAAQKDAERKEKKQAEQAQKDVEQALAAAAAVKLWDGASDAGESPYMARKGVRPFGVRFADGGWLLVPMRDAAGVLWSVQRIAPKKNGSDNDKWYGPQGVSGSRKTGLWHWCGNPVGAPTLLIAEGYATAASLHEATGHPVAVAFDVGGLGHVAKALHSNYPNALLVLCGDDDRETEFRTGKNPGRKSATEAAHAVQGVAVFPENLPEGGTDFNDMHQAVGLEAVREIVDGAIASYDPVRETPKAVASKGKKKRSTAVVGPATDDQGGGSSAKLAEDAFSVDDRGVWHTAFDNHGRPKVPEWVCSRLNVEAYTRNKDGHDWGYLLTFDDRLGETKQWAMPSRLLAGDGSEYRATLFYMGLRVHTSPRTKGLLTQYIQSRAADEFATCTDTIGWDSSSRAFVLPRETIGNPPERVIFQSEKAIENTFIRKGTSEHWRERVGAHCVGNTRLTFAVSVAFAGPLLKPAGMESGGFHLVGDSSCGKTTCLTVAGSVWGGKGFKRTWQGTGVGFEVVAGASCDTVLLLDELKECDPKVAAQVVYMLGNQQGKMRGNTGVQMRPMTRWNVLFLSTGEITLEQHLASINAKINEGQKTRLVNIPADAGAGLGSFENLHGCASGESFSDLIKHSAQSVYGSIGREWLEWLTGNTEILKSTIKANTEEFAKTLIPAGAGGQVARVGMRFAMVGAAGEMATAAGMTGWPVGEALQAARVNFAAWLVTRGGIGNGEEPNILRTVRQFFESDGEGRFTLWHRAGDDHASKTLKRAGYRRVFYEDGTPFKDIGTSTPGVDPSLSLVLSDGGYVRYYVFPECFRSEICKEADYKKVAHILIKRGILLPGSGRPFDSKQRLPGMGNKPVTCYEITDEIFRVELD